MLHLTLPDIHHTLWLQMLIVVLARQSKENPRPYYLWSGAIAMATAMMYLRILVIAGVFRGLPDFFQMQFFRAKNCRQKCLK